jgi:hypothetical protein
MIGYVPFPVTNYHFINNSEWVENIFPAVKKIYKTDLERTIKQIVDNNPNAYWSSTSNTTFRVDVFNEFMKWFEPVGNEIKETKTCGHAHERAISFFYMTKNKKIILTQGLLRHLQMDSHKTQGHEVDYNKNLETLLK